MTALPDACDTVCHGRVAQSKSSVPDVAALRKLSPGAAVRGFFGGGAGLRRPVSGHMTGHHQAGQGTATHGQRSKELVCLHPQPTSHS